MIKKKKKRHSPSKHCKSYKIVFFVDVEEMNIHIINKRNNIIRCLLPRSCRLGEHNRNGGVEKC